MSDTAMYICVLDEVPDFITPTLVAHAVLNHSFHTNNYIGDLEPLAWLFDEWINESYKKRVCRVNRKEFEKIKAIPGVCLTHENKTLNGEKSCATIVVRDGEKPNVLKFAKLWSPKNV